MQDRPHRNERYVRGARSNRRVRAPSTDNERAHIFFIVFPQGNFVKIQEAWEILKDPVRRNDHDAFLDNLARQSDDRGVVTEVDLDDMSYENAAFSTACRCGAQICVTEAQLDNGIDIVPCEGCSTLFRILFDVVDEDGEEEEDDDVS